MSGDAPRFAHDCDRCTFLGRFEQCDLYFCEQGNMPTVIARCGDRGPEYISGLAFAEVEPALAEAKRRSLKRGLLK